MATAFLLSSPRRRGSSGTRGAPVWIPARPCGPSGMTSVRGWAVRDDVPARPYGPSGMTPVRGAVGVASRENGAVRGTSMEKGCREDAQGAKVRHILLLSSRGRRRRNPGSSDLAATAWLAGSSNGRRTHWRDARLDPGSALRAVRDDISEGCAPCGTTYRPGPARGGYAALRERTPAQCGGGTLAAGAGVLLAWGAGAPAAGTSGCSGRN